MTDPIEAREAGLRRLPPAYSLALRLRDAGVADDVMCEYLDVEPEALDTLLRLAEMKLDAMRAAGEDEWSTTQAASPED